MDWDGLIARAKQNPFPDGRGYFSDHHVYIVFEKGEPKALTPAGFTDGTFDYPPAKHRSKNYHQGWVEGSVVCEALPTDPTHGTLKRYVQEKGFEVVEENVLRATFSADGSLATEGWASNGAYYTKGPAGETLKDQRGGSGRNPKALALEAAERLLEFAAS